MELSQSALVSVRVPLPEGFHAGVESQDDAAVATVVGRRHVTAWVVAAMWPLLVSAASALS